MEKKGFNLRRVPGGTEKSCSTLCVGSFYCELPCLDKTPFFPRWKSFDPSIAEIHRRCEQQKARGEKGLLDPTWTRTSNETSKEQLLNNRLALHNPCFNTGSKLIKPAGIASFARQQEASPKLRYLKGFLKARFTELVRLQGKKPNKETELVSANCRNYCLISVGNFRSFSRSSWWLFQHCTESVDAL